MDPRVPDKPTFKIGEVARLAGVATSVLRFWESEFPSLRPRKTRTKQRMYTREDVSHVLRIRDLLYGEGFTIEGARRRLSGTTTKLLGRIRKEVEEILRLAEE